MKELLVKWPKNFSRPAEIYKNGLEYAILDKDLKPLHVPIRCKDFLTDVFWLERMQKNDVLYGFKWERIELYKEPKIIIAIRNINNPLGSVACEKLNNFLLDLKEALKFKYTHVKPLLTKNNSIIINVDKCWYDVPHIWSMYLLFLRIGIYYNKKVHKNIQYFLDNLSSMSIKNQNDIIYVNQASKSIKSILSGKIDMSQKYEDYSTIRSAHYNSGIVSFKSSIYG